jgi:N-acylneuraminate cytidylyltransferase
MTESHVVAVIPARARDLAPDGAPAMLGPRPLLAYTVEAARAASTVRRVLVSTDAPAVADLARSLGAEVPFLRPAELAAPGVPLAAVLRHAVEWLDAAGSPPDIVVLLEPSHPIRPAGLVDAVVEALGDGDLDSVFAAFEDTHAFWYLDDTGALLPVLQAEDATRGRRRPIYRELTGLVCATRASVVRGGEKIGRRVGIVPVRDFGGLADTQDPAGRRLAERLVAQGVEAAPRAAAQAGAPRSGG